MSRSRRETVARFLYKNDGNKLLPSFRIWSLLSRFWQERYLALADELLEQLDSIKEQE